MKACETLEKRVRWWTGGVSTWGGGTLHENRKVGWDSKGCQKLVCFYCKYSIYCIDSFYCTDSFAVNAVN